MQPAEFCNHLQTTLLADIQQPPSLDCLAQRYTLRKETLIRQFKLATGLTPGAWVNNARVEFAKAQLRAGRDIADGLSKWFCRSKPFPPYVRQFYLVHAPAVCAGAINIRQ
jgi:methylphosphotriester-DNA--protein-cysteine methyltransferase